ncbi:PDDEXK nuclease domain-containing protein [Cnuibacter sp. UC19_7]|uniref:PDDEXK nuclease domain-containing protein n=1 Tax=Cnuibacter sp. UC19_7 TaxID=3350166 RepID=UPI00366FD646
MSPGQEEACRHAIAYMRRFAESWTEDAILQQAVGELPWSHIVSLLDKLDDPSLRDRYALRDLQHGWSRAVLTHQIATGLRDREGAAPSNFGTALEPADSELAQQITKDPYTLDFSLSIQTRPNTSSRTGSPRGSWRPSESSPGGFAFVGRQVHFDVDGDDFFVDILFFHVQQLRYVVIELKTTEFDPRDAGQLGFYVALVDDLLRDEALHRPAMGMLLVADKNETVVRYALAGTAQPVAVSRYELFTSDAAALPAVDTLTRIAADAVADSRHQAPSST